jgi:putative ATPase
MKDLGYSEGYKYAHDYEGHFVLQQFLPDGLTSASFWHPQDNPAEARLADRLHTLWKDRY